MLTMQNESKHIVFQNFEDNSRFIKFLFFYIENLDTLTTSNIFTLNIVFFKNVFSIKIFLNQMN